MAKNDEDSGQAVGYLWLGGAYIPSGSISVDEHKQKKHIMLLLKYLLHED